MVSVLCVLMGCLCPQEQSVAKVRGTRFTFSAVSKLIVIIESYFIVSENFAVLVPVLCVYVFAHESRVMPRFRIRDSFSYANGI